MGDYEAVNQLPGSGNVREKKLGLTIGDKDADGKYIVTGIESGSFAANAKLAVGDVIMEINGRPTNEMDKQAIDNYIANKWGSGSSIMIVYEREGKMDIVSLKKNPTTGTESN